MGAEFNITPNMVALMQGKDIDTKLLMINFDSATLYSNAVCAAIANAYPN